MHFNYKLQTFSKGIITNMHKRNAHKNSLHYSPVSVIMIHSSI